MANNFTSALINPATYRQIKLFIKQPAHGLLITGVKGVGKKFIAQLLAAELLGIAASELENHPYYFVVSKEDGKSEISIDAARQLIKKLTLKVVDDKQPMHLINRVALIKDSDLLSTEAQNAILKLLEEPPAGSLIILTAESDSDLLPTISSRLQRITILPLDLEKSRQFFANSHNQAEIESAWRLSRGASGLMSGLLNDSDDHPLSRAVTQSKQMLKLDTYHRLIFLQALAKDKVELHMFLEALAKVLKALHESSITKGNNSNSTKLLQARKLVSESLSSAELNSNPRLVALSLAARIPL